MKLTSKGQVTIPIEIRTAMGWSEGTQVRFVREGDKVLVKAEDDGLSVGERLVRRLGGIDKGQGMSTDELMALTRGED